MLEGKEHSDGIMLPQDTQTEHTAAVEDKKHHNSL